MKKEKPASVTRMPFAITAKDRAIPIANKVSLAMDSIAPVRKKKERKATMHVKDLQYFTNASTCIL